MSSTVIRERLRRAGLSLPFPESDHGMVPLARRLRWNEVLTTSAGEMLSRADHPLRSRNAWTRMSHHRSDAVLHFMLEAAGYRTEDIPHRSIMLCAGLPVPSDLSVIDAYHGAPDALRGGGTLSLASAAARRTEPGAHRIRSILHNANRRQAESKGPSGPEREFHESLAELLHHSTGGDGPPVALTMASLREDEEIIVALAVLAKTGMTTTPSARAALEAAARKNDLLARLLRWLEGKGDAGAIEESLTGHSARRTAAACLLLGTAVQRGLITPTPALDLLDGTTASSAHFSGHRRRQTTPIQFPAGTWWREEPEDNLLPFLDWARIQAILAGGMEGREQAAAVILADRKAEDSMRLLASLRLLETDPAGEALWRRVVRELWTDDEAASAHGLDPRRLLMALWHHPEQRLAPDQAAVALHHRGPLLPFLALPGTRIPPALDPWLELDDDIPDRACLRLLQRLRTTSSMMQSDDDASTEVLIGWLLTQRPHLAPVFEDVAQGIGQTGLSRAAAAQALLMTPHTVSVSPLRLRATAGAWSIGHVDDTPEVAAELLALLHDEATIGCASSLMSEAGPVVRSLAHTYLRTAMQGPGLSAGPAPKKSEKTEESPEYQPPPWTEWMAAMGTGASPRQEARRHEQALERAALGLPTTAGDILRQIERSTRPRGELLEQALEDGPSDLWNELCRRNDLWDPVPTNEVEAMVLNQLRTPARQFEGLGIVEGILAPRGPISRAIDVEVALLAHHRHDQSLRSRADAVRADLRLGSSVSLLLDAVISDDGVDATLMRRLLRTNDRRLLLPLGASARLWKGLTDAQRDDLLCEWLTADEERSSSADSDLRHQLAVRGLLRQALDGPPLSPKIHSMLGTAIREDADSEWALQVSHLAGLDSDENETSPPLAWRTAVVASNHQNAFFLSHWLTDENAVRKAQGLAPEEATQRLMSIWTNPATGGTPRIQDPHPNTQKNRREREGLPLGLSGAMETALWAALPSDVAQEAVRQLLLADLDRTVALGCAALLGLHAARHEVPADLAEVLTHHRISGGPLAREAAETVSMLLGLFDPGAQRIRQSAMG